MRRIHAALALTVLGAAACQGKLDAGPALPGGAGRGPEDPSQCSDEIVLGTAPMRRLANVEYARTLRVLFPAVAPSLPSLPDDAAVIGFENDARSLGPTDVGIARYEEIAFRYTSEATRDDTALRELTGCAAFATDAEAMACGASFVSRFGLRTHRRPLTDEERARYVSFFEARRAEIDFAAAVQLTAMAMLQAPPFLYRLEIAAGASEDTTGGVAVALSQYELASRLSFLLWGTMPDETLFAAAEAGELTDADALEAEARRMLEDPRARDLVADFHRQWLDFDRVLAPEHGSRVHDAEGLFAPDAQRAAREELLRFVAAEVFDGEGTLSSLFTSRRSFVNSTLAGLYGVDGPTSPTEWREVELPAGERAGLLTRIGPLASHAHAGNSSPPLRGVYVMERVLCEQRPSPPPDADLSPPMPTPGAGPQTNRDLFEIRTSGPTCQGCHVRIDGYGFLFENFDERGVFRSVDNTHPVDATGAITGTDVDGPVDGAIELSERLAESGHVQQCAVQRWFRFSQGRAPEEADACHLDSLERRFARSGGDIRELLVSMVRRPEFRLRPEVTP
jgi:hypothetical protein